MDYEVVLTEPARDDLGEIVGGNLAQARRKLRYLQQNLLREGNELKLIEQPRAYYLIPRTIVHVIQKNAVSGTSQIQRRRVSRPLWTLGRFLKRATDYRSR